MLLSEEIVLSGFLPVFEVRGHVGDVEAETLLEPEPGGVGGVLLAAERVVHNLLGDLAGIDFFISGGLLAALGTACRERRNGRDAENCHE